MDDYGIYLAFYREEHETAPKANEAGALYFMGSDISMGYTALMDTIEAIGTAFYAAGIGSVMTVITNRSRTKFYQGPIPYFREDGEFWEAVKGMTAEATNQPTA